MPGLLKATICVAVVMLTACGWSQAPTDTGDPGNERVDMLAADPVSDSLSILCDDSPSDVKAGMPRTYQVSASVPAVA